MSDGVPSIVDLNEQVLSTLGMVRALLGEGFASSASLASAWTLGPSIRSSSTLSLTRSCIHPAWVAACLKLRISASRAMKLPANWVCRLASTFVLLFPTSAQLQIPASGYRLIAATGYCSRRFMPLQNAMAAPPRSAANPAEASSYAFIYLGHCRIHNHVRPETPLIPPTVTWPPLHRPWRSEGSWLL
jgi:hypothetical protein